MISTKFKEGDRVYYIDSVSGQKEYGTVIAKEAAIRWEKDILENFHTERKEVKEKWERMIKVVGCFDHSVVPLKRPLMMLSADQYGFMEEDKIFLDKPAEQPVVINEKSSFFKAMKQLIEEI